MNSKLKTQIALGLTGLGLTIGSANAALVAQWNFEDVANPSNSSSTFDAQVASGTSDAIGTGISVSTDTAAPGSTQSLSFDGTGLVDTNVTGTALGIGGSSAKTITGWFKTSSTSRQVIVDFTVGSNGEDLRVIYDPFGSGGFGAGTGLRLELSGGAAAIHDASGVDTSADLDLNDGQWHFFAAIVPANAQAQNVDFYISNGANAGTIYGDALGSTRAFNTAGAATFQFGNDSRVGVPAPFTGLLDDIRIYDTALSQSELDALAIPEPSSALLVGFGVLAVALRRRR